jgi:hypothetical protein
MKAINKCNVWAIMLVAVMSIGLVSCSKDDDNGLDSPIAQKVIGTWYASDTSINRYCTVTFYSDGTGDLYSEYQGKYRKSDAEMTGEFTWSCSGNKIKTYGQYVYIDYSDGTVDTDYDPEVDYVYNESNSTLTGGRYSGLVYTKR